MASMIEAILPSPNWGWANWGLLAGGRDRGRDRGRLASHREGPREVGRPWEHTDRPTGSSGRLVVMVAWAFLYIDN